MCTSRQLWEEALQRLNPGKGKTRTDAVVELLLDLIRTERYQPGDRLPPELQLADQFSVGRTTMREALQVLAATGVIRRTKRGTTLAEIPTNLTAEELRIGATERSVQALYEARRFLEAALAALAAERATPGDLARMRQEIARLASAPLDNWEAIVEADVAFHSRVAQAARNEVLSQMFNMARSLLVKRLPPLHERAEVIQRSVARHWQVYQAIADRNPVQAAEVMVKNLTASEQMVLRLAAQLRATPAEL